MSARTVWLSELVWQAAAVGAVPAVVALAIVFANLARPPYPASYGDHAHSGPYCNYCVASRSSGLSGAPEATDVHNGAADDHSDHVGDEAHRRTCHSCNLYRQPTALRGHDRRVKNGPARLNLVPNVAAAGRPG